MRIHFALFLLLFSFATLSAQKADWVRSFQQNNSANPIMNHQLMASLDNGAFWVQSLVNRRTSYSQRHLGDLNIYKMTTTNNMVDTVKVFGNASLFGIDVHQLETTMMFEYLDSIRVADTSLSLGLNKYQALVHVDASGKEKFLWSQPDSITAFSLNNQGDITFVTGIGGFSSGVGRITLLDQTANVLATRALPGLGFTYQVDQTPNGDYLLSGSCMNQNFTLDSLSNPVNSFYNYWLLCLDSTFSGKWLKVIPDITCRNTRHAIDPFGNSFLTSATNSYLSFDGKSTDGPGGFSDDFFLAKNGSGAVFEWVREIPGDTGFYRAKPGNDQNVAADANGNVYFVGKWRGNTLIWPNGDTLFPTPLSDECLIASWDSTGGLRWAKNYGGDGFDFLNSLLVLGEDELIVSGMASDTIQFDSITMPGTQGTEFVLHIIKGAVAPPPFLASQNLAICAGDTAWVAGNFYFQTGTYTDTLPGAQMDTLLTTNLTVFTLPQVSISLAPDSVCTVDPPIVLNLNPAGGMLSGPGTADSTFTPALAGPGTFVLNYTFADTNGCENSDSASVYVDICLNLSENILPTFSVYPNPTRKIITIRGINSGKKIHLRNILGRALEIKEDFRKNNEIQLDISALQSGIYFLGMANSQEVIWVKFLKD